MKKSIKVFSNISLVLGIGFLLSPILLNWFIHGDYKRYIKIINGPFPFSQFGSGPFQLVMYAGLLIISLLFFVISFFINKTNKHSSKS